MVKRNDEPSAEQVEALTAYAAQHGRTWKAQLRQEWMNATASWPLMQIRNQFGPRWLTIVKIQDPR